MGRVKPQGVTRAADPAAKYRGMVGDGNRFFAATNDQFRAACERAGVEPTRRQASKWRRGFGSAWAQKNT